MNIRMHAGRRTVHKHMIFPIQFSIQQVSLRDIGIDSMLEYLKNDKKMSQGSITMSIPEDFGTHRNVKMTPENLRSHLRSFRETFDTLPAA